MNIIHEGTNTTIIGIANSVDLIQKFTAGSKKEWKLVQQKLVFEPYTAEQIEEVIIQKITDCYEKHDFDPSLKDMYDQIVQIVAIRLISKTVAKATGDIRVAFHLFKSNLI